MKNVVSVNNLLNKFVRGVRKFFRTFLVVTTTTINATNNTTAAVAVASDAR